MNKNLPGWLAGLMAVFVVASIACNPYGPTPTDNGGTVVNVNQNVNVGQGGTSGGTGGSGSNGPCLPVARVGVKLHGSTDTRASSAAVGTAVTLDATPKDQADNIRPDACNTASPISWGVAGPCTILDGSSYTPNIKGNAPGVCYVSATVGGITSNAYELTVTAAPARALMEDAELSPADFDPARWVHDEAGS